MPKIIHIADIHLDSPFNAHLSQSEASVMRGELQKSFSELIEYAKNVDILLIAGDLFDSDDVSEMTVAFVKRKFSEIPDTRIFICAGNHDPYTFNSVYAKTDFGSNVHIFSSDFECVRLDDLKTRVWGISFSERYGSFSDKVKLKKEDDGYSDILLLHGDLGASSDSNYNPIERSFIENCGADYLALGHIHKRSDIDRLGNTYFSYPGGIFGRGFDECGEMGFYVGDVEKNMVKLEFKPLNGRKFFVFNVDVTNKNDYMEIVELISNETKKLGDLNDFYRVNLVGRINHNILKLDLTEEILKNEFKHIELIDLTKVDFEIDEIEKEDNVCGEFVRLMKQMLDDADENEALIYNEALSLGVEAMLGGDL